jgi:hypothetical protein
MVETCGVGGLRAFDARVSAIAIASLSIALGHDASKFSAVLSVQEDPLQ